MYLGLDNLKSNHYNKAKQNLDVIVQPNKKYSAIDMIDIKHTKWFEGRTSKLGRISFSDFCEMINRNYFDGLLNHTKKYRTSPNPVLNFKNALGQWINEPIKIKRISSDLKLARLVLVAEEVNRVIRDQADHFNDQNHVMFRENGQAIFKRVEVMTLVEYLQNLEAQSWFELRPNALEEIKVKYLTNTIEV